MSCCKTRFCHAHSYNDLEGHSNYSSAIYSFSILCLEHSLMWRSTVAFTYLKVKSAKCLCLLPVILVLVLLFWFWSCKQRSWSWYCYFGLGLKNLVLFTSLGRGPSNTGYISIDVCLTVSKGYYWVLADV